jgi:hypothetical protein
MPGAAPHAKNRREHGTTPGEFGYEASTAKASRQSPIIVRLGTDSVNLFRQQIYKTLVSVAATEKHGLFFDCPRGGGKRRCDRALLVLLFEELLIELF